MSYTASAAPTPDAFGNSSTASWSSPSYDDAAYGYTQQQQPMIVQSRSFEGSPLMPSFGGWSPLLNGMQSHDAEQKHWTMEAVTAIENLHVDDLVFDAAANSSPSDSGLGLNAAAGSAAFASLPAWNSSSNLAATLSTAPRAATSDEDDAQDEPWLKTKSLRRGGRRVCVSSAASMSAAPPSPSAAAAQAAWKRPLRQAVSAPELQHSLSSSSQLDDILEAMDADAGSSSQRPSTGGASSNAIASGSSSSAASGSTLQGALFQRRTERQGLMPMPKPVTTSVMTGSLSSGPTYASLPNEPYLGLQHSRSATIPTSNGLCDLLPAQHSVWNSPFDVSRPPANFDFVQPVQKSTSDRRLTPEQSEQAARHTQAALVFGQLQTITAAEQEYCQQEQQKQSLINARSHHRRPSSAASVQSSNGLQTPVTPMHALGPAPMSYDACSTWPSPIGADLNFNSFGMPAPYAVAAPYSTNARLSNSLGLSAVPQPAQRQLPSVDTASFAQVYGAAQVASVATAQQTQSLLQLQSQGAQLAQQQQAMLKSSVAPSSNAMSPPPSSPTKQRSSPNLRAGSPRKIASNRRVVSGETRPRRCTVGAGASHTIPLPPIPRQRKQTVSANSAPAAFKMREAPAKSAINFVNYTLADRDELCAAVAPSGSYKVPLRGWGLDEAADAAALAERAATAAARRSGPRWEERKEVPVKAKAASPEEESDSERAVKRKKSTASIAASSPPGAKSPVASGSTTRKVNRKQSRSTVAQ